MSRHEDVKACEDHSPDLSGAPLTLPIELLDEKNIRPEKRI